MQPASPNGRIRAVVFDFDGTLAELTIDFGLMRRRVEDVARDYLDPLPSTDSLPVLEWVAKVRDVLAATDRHEAAGFFAKCHALIEAMEMEGARKGRLFPTARPLLKALSARGMGCAVITRNCENAVLQVFPDLAEHCACFLARDHVARVKPDPDHLLKALRCLGCAPEHGLMVGDHPLDVHTGLGAGTLTAGVAGGRMSEASLREAGAHVTAPDLRRLVERLVRAGHFPALDLG